MSPTLLAHLERLARQTRRDVAQDHREGRTLTRVTDYYAPLELTRRCSWNRPATFIERHAS